MQINLIYARADNGIGTADFTTRRLVNKTDCKSMYANGLTSTVAIHG